MSAPARIIVGVADALQLVESLVKEWRMRRIPDSRSDGERIIDVAATANRAVLACFSAIEAGMIFAGKKSDALHLLKGIELLPRTFNIHTQLALAIRESKDEENALRRVVRVAEKGIVLPIAALCAAGAQASGYYEQHFLEMSPEEFAKAQRPIFGVSPNGDVEVIGYRPVDRAECEENLAQARAAAWEAAKWRAGAQVGVGEIAVCDVGGSLYGKLVRFFNFGQPQAPAAAAGGAAPQPVAALGVREMAEEALNFNLMNLPRIPPPLHEDVVLRRFQCAITHEPIRDPVRDPNGRMLYERAAIREWITSHHTSPATRLPLEMNQLQEMPVVRAVIDSRLSYHQTALLRFVELQLNAPVDPATQAVIDAHA